jgi:hypothetical protein
MIFLETSGIWQTEYNNNLHMAIGAIWRLLLSDARRIRITAKKI